MNNPDHTLWHALIGTPEHYEFDHTLLLLRKMEFPEFDAELYLQANGPGTFQRLLLVFPKELKAPVPAVAVPFYFPEAMIGFELDSGEELPRYKGIEMMLHLVRRGYAACSADAYHLTSVRSLLGRGEWQRWHDCGTALHAGQPKWSGMGKLTADTQLMIDVLCADSRIDAERIGIAGHSLGGKMAFYAGCLDDRVKAILASDFGIGWDQTNWNDCWYWGERVEEFKAAGIDHSSLLNGAAPKPFCLIAGLYDNQESEAYMKRAKGYASCPERLKLLNHATGHRPPFEFLIQGYDFLDRWLK